MAIATDAGLRVVQVLDRPDDVTHTLSVSMGPAVIEGEAPSGPAVP